MCCCQQALAQAARMSLLWWVWPSGCIAEKKPTSTSPPAGLLWERGRQVPACPARAATILLLPSAANEAGKERRRLGGIAGGQAGRSVPLLSGAQGSQGTARPYNPEDPAEWCKLPSSTHRWRGDGSVLPGCGVQGAAGAVSLLGRANSQELRLPVCAWRSKLGSCHGWAWVLG